ncbi:phospholipase b-related [Anaeramoeba ignava]|uniref:Phospholipase B-like n=1 Tax=Anaeramoeba ignava TaxID=1746090 RepID=A0A9Q0RDP2_ANAIG|nr:phospholipase b-related [Anaeramoeba ignava]
MIKIICFLLIFLFVSSERTIISVYYQNSTYSVTPGIADPDAVCYAIFSDTMFEIGASKLHIYTNSEYDDEIQMYAAGFAEGYLTQQRIWDYLTNWKIDFISDYNTTDWPHNITVFMEANENYLQEQCQNTSKTDYMNQICLNYEQYKGIFDGYSSVAPSEQNITSMDLWILNSGGDLDDLGIALFLLSEDPKEQEWAMKRIKDDHWQELHSHCTGLVKVLDGNTDIFFSQDTWSGFVSLSRVWKEYNFKLNSANVQSIVFSSYPGVIFSVDDFYVTSAQLGVLETTFNIFNDSLYKEYITNQTILTWLRVTAVNRLCTNGPDWIQMMNSINSGTYNNQWLVLDHKLFTKGEPIQDNLLWVLEMIPGYTWYGDVTDWLRNRTWYPSINTPTNLFLFDIAGFAEKVKEVGNYWSYWNCSRMLIMERDLNNKVYSYETFKEFMRYNHYQVDPLSNGDPAESISSRYDLRITNTSDHKLQAAAFGALDSKTVNHLQIFDMQFDAVSSPIHKWVPVWEFGVGKWADVPHQGIPQRWEFPWHDFQSFETTTCGDLATCGDCIQSSSCGWCNDRCQKYPVLVGEESNCPNNDWILYQCPAPNPSTSTTSSSSGLSTGGWVGIVIAVAVVFGVVGFFLSLFIKKKRNYKPINSDDTEDDNLI